jgi:hypothetical protein
MVAFPVLSDKLLINITTAGEFGGGLLNLDIERDIMKKLAGTVMASFILASAIAVWAGEEALPKDLDSYTCTG